MNFIVNLGRYFIMIPLSYLISLFLVGWSVEWLNKYFSLGAWTITAAIMVFVTALLIAYCYMGIGLFISPAKNWFVKLVLAIPFLLLSCVFTGLISVGTMFLNPSSSGSTILPYVWESGIFVCGSLYGIVKGFQTNGK